MVRKQNKRDSTGTKEESSTTETIVVVPSSPSSGMMKKIDIGLDASTTTVGICLLDHDTGDMIEISYLDLSSKAKFEDLYEKIEYTRDHLKDLFKTKNYSLGRIYIEEEAKRFSPGFSSADTLFTLAKFNHSICQFFYDSFSIKPVKINVRTARKLLAVNVDYKDKTKSTKQKVFDIVRTQNPSFPWFTYIPKSGKNKDQQTFMKQNEDMADAWVIAKGGYLLNKNNKSV